LSLQHRPASFDTRRRLRLGAAQDEDGLLMASKKFLILRSPRSGRLEGRTTVDLRFL